MANQLEITKQYEDGAWQVTSVVADGHEVGFPDFIFLWTLDRDGKLDKFQCIGTLDQVTRYPLFDPDRTSNFGVHLVRTDSSKQSSPLESEIDKAIIVLKGAFDNLLAEFDEVGMPITELYPLAE